MIIPEKSLMKLANGSDIRGTFDELSKLFDEIQGEDSELEVDAEFDDEPEVEDEFADVNFGEDEMHESIKLKPVQEPQKTEKEGVNKKSPVASNAKSPVEGVKPVRIKDGSVDVTDDKFKNSDAETAKVEDNNNILSSGKDVMKPAKTPKNTAEKSKSVLPKQ
jgi:phage terminase small subunit